MARSPIQQLTERLMEYAKLTIIAMLLIYVVYKVAEELVGQVPAVVGSAIGALAITYILVTKEGVRERILQFGRK